MLGACFMPSVPHKEKGLLRVSRGEVTILSLRLTAAFTLTFTLQLQREKKWVKPLQDNIATSGGL